MFDRFLSSTDVKLELIFCMRIYQMSSDPLQFVFGYAIMFVLNFDVVLFGLASFSSKESLSFLF